MSQSSEWSAVLAIFGDQCVRAGGLLSCPPMALLPSPLLHAQAEADELSCPICFGTMLQPRALPGCTARHVFCAPCITLWFELCGSQRTCPIDRRALPTDEEPTFDVVTEAALRNRRVRCPNAQLGCTAPPLTLDLCQRHLQEECEFRTVQCPHCKKPQSAAALRRHVDK